MTETSEATTVADLYGDAAAEPPAEDLLTRLAENVRELRDLDREIAALSADLEAKAKARRQLAEVAIPGILDETGLSELRLADGTKVKVTEDLRVSTTGKHREPINEWLRETGHADLIRTEVVVAFNPGYEDSAKELAEVAEEFDGYKAAEGKVYVNPASFAALLRELRAAQVEVPYDRLGVFLQRGTKLEAPRS